MPYFATRAYELTTGNYIGIVVGSHLDCSYAFELSANANQPNGVNIYLGSEAEVNLAGCRRIMTEALPDGARRALVQRVAEIARLQD